jgi:hypothetical protein
MSDSEGWLRVVVQGGPADGKEFQILAGQDWLDVPRPHVINRAQPASSDPSLELVRCPVRRSGQGDWVAVWPRESGD